MEGLNPNAAAIGGEQCWRGFERGRWSAAIDVRDFIVRNVAPYTGDESFLVGPSARTQAVWDKVATVFRRRADRRACSTSMPRRPRPFWRTALATSIGTMR